MPRVDDEPARGGRGRLRFRPKIGATLATLVCVAILLGLGSWQVERLAWKTGLIEGAARAVAAEPVPLPARLHDPRTFDFVRVRLTGRLIHDKTLYLSSRTYQGRVGQHAVTPLVRSDGGGVVLVDRGWVPPDWRAPAQAGIAGEIVEGMARVFPEPGLFTLDNDVVRNIWFIVSQGEMAAAIDLGGVAPVFVTVSPGPDPAVVPIGETPGLNLPNNHLIYAITWYALALALLTIYGVHSSRRDEV